MTTTTKYDDLYEALATRSADEICAEIRGGDLRVDGASLYRIRRRIEVLDSDDRDLVRAGVGRYDDERSEPRAVRSYLYRVVRASVDRRMNDAATLVASRWCESEGLVGATLLVLDRCAIAGSLAARPDSIEASRKFWDLVLRLVTFSGESESGRNFAIVDELRTDRRVDRERVAELVYRFVASRVERTAGVAEIASRLPVPRKWIAEALRTLEEDDRVYGDWRDRNRRWMARSPEEVEREARRRETSGEAYEILKELDVDGNVYDGLDDGPPRVSMNASAFVEMARKLRPGSNGRIGDPEHAHAEAIIWEVDHIAAKMYDWIGTNGDKATLGFDADEILDEYNQYVRTRCPHGHRGFPS